MGHDFSNWIKNRIEEFSYEEGRDYVEIFGSPNSANQNGRGGGRRSIEYHLTLDMAKELAMIERNTMGRVARKYFIRCEQEAMAFIPAMRQALLDANLLWSDLVRYQAAGLTRREICLLVGTCKDTVRKHFRQMEQCGITAPPPTGLDAMRRKAGITQDKRQLQLFPVGALR